MERIEISPAPLAQVHRTRVGRNIQIDDDVQGVARDLREIDPRLRLEFDPGQELYVVYQTVVLEDGSVQDELVTVWSVERNGPLDKRLVRRCQEITAPGYDLAAELDRVDAEAAKRAEYEFEQRVGPVIDRLGSALLKDLGEQPRIYVPGDRRRGRRR